MVSRMVKNLNYSFSQEFMANDQIENQAQAFMSDKMFLSYFIINQQLDIQFTSRPNCKALIRQVLFFVIFMTMEENSSVRCVK